MNWKKLLLVLSFLTIFGLIILLTYFQIIIWNEGMIVAIIVISLIGSVVTGLWYFLSKKRPLKLTKAFDIIESENLSKQFWALRGTAVMYPSDHKCWGRLGYDEEGTEMHVFNGIGTSRVQETDGKMIPIEPEGGSDSRFFTVVNATERKITDWYSKITLKESEERWKSLGLTSVKKPTRITKKVEETPFGTRREEITAPIGSEELQPKEELP